MDPSEACPDYGAVYARVKAAKDDYADLLIVDQRSAEAVDALRRVTEMVLVHEYAPWYFGDPQRNISKAIVVFCAKVADDATRPSAALQLAGTLLAWTHARLELPTDAAHVLLEHALAFVAPSAGDRLVADEPWPELRQVQGRWRDERGLSPLLDELSVDELTIWNEISRWELETAGKLSRLDARADGDKESTEPTPLGGLARVAANTLQQALGALRDAAAVFMRDEQLLEEVRALGYVVDDIKDLRGVPLEALEPLSKTSLLVGKVVGALEGAGTGLGGIFLTAVDVPALLTINLRFVSRIAHTYGFDTRSQAEQAFILNVFGAASATEDSRSAFIDNMNRLAADTVVKGALRPLDSRAFLALLRKVAQLIGLRLAERKLAQIVPFAGAVVGGRLNYTYTRDTLLAARMMYRKRRLAEQVSMTTIQGVGA